MKSNTRTLEFNLTRATVETFRHQHYTNLQAVRLPVQVIVQKHVVDLARVLTFIQCQIKVGIVKHIESCF